MEENSIQVDTIDAPEKTEEQKRISAIKAVARDNVIAAANQYLKTRNRDLLKRIQQIVDELDDAFVLVIPQKDGVPYSVTFNPRESVPQIPTDTEAES